MVQVPYYSHTYQVFERALHVGHCDIPYLILIASPYTSQWVSDCLVKLSLMKVCIYTDGCAPHNIAEK